MTASTAIIEAPEAPEARAKQLHPSKATSSPLDNPTTVLRKVQVILKTAERCNLACPYCYYFYMGDQSYLQRPRVIKPDTLSAVAGFLRDGAVAMNLEEVQIVFHGGEPLLQKKAAFDESCSVLRDTIAPHAKVSFAIQSNGTLIDEAWVELFEKHSVRVGISIDGPPEHHDKMRPDHRGRGSHGATMKGIRLLQAAADQKRMPAPGTLTVLSHQVSTEAVLDHLLDDLRVKGTGFLLPDRSRDAELEEGESIAQYGQSLCTIFERWTRDPDAFSVREIQDVVGFFQLHTAGQQPGPEPDVAAEPAIEIANQIIVIQSDGKVAVDDSLIPALKWREDAPVSDVRTGSLKEFLRHEAFGEIWRALTVAPSACSGCRWVNLCRGGSLENRYSRENGFDNPSVYCEALQMLYSSVERFLLDNGYPQELIQKKLARETTDYNGAQVF